MNALPPIPRRVFNAILILGTLAIVASVLFAPINGEHFRTKYAALQVEHALGLAMFSYANDNDGNYPDGKSSTEVFQKLLDGGYVTDPSYFYLPAPGKTRAESGQKLKPENICFDVTSGLTLHSAKELPIIFLTGYRVNYSPGGSAVPVIKPYPHYGGPESRSWTQWWNGEKMREPMEPGIAVFRIDYKASWMDLVTAPDGTGSIPNFISPDFKPDGKTYRQLTPDGPLP